MDDMPLEGVPEDEGGVHPPPKTIELDHETWMELERFRKGLEREFKISISLSFAIREALRRASGPL